MSEPEPNIVIIGGGISGIVQAKWLLNMTPPPKVTLLEQHHALGGVWDIERDNGVMDCTVCNVSKYCMELSGFPWPQDTVNFPHHSKVLEYIQSYKSLYLSDQEQLTILCNCKVVEVTKAERDNHGYFWIITYHETIADRFKVLAASHVIVANGHTSSPHYPIPKVEEITFVSHACNYKNCSTNDLFRKNVLVVGLSFSAIDIAVDLIEKGGNTVAVLTRSGSWFTNKTDRNGKPSDIMVPRIFTRLPHVIQSKILKLKLNFSYFNQNNWAISNETDPAGGNLVSSDKFVSLVQDGKINVIHGSISEIRQDGLIKISDNISSNSFDHVIFCTGYKPTFEFLSEDLKDTGFVSDETFHSNLYLNMISPELGSRLCFVGLLNVRFTSPIQMMELQARYIAKLISGEISLPSEQTMVNSMSTHREYLLRHCKAFRASLFLPSQYRDTVADLMGCLPRVSLLSPKHWIQHHFGPMTWASYNLNEGLHIEARKSLDSICNVAWGNNWFARLCIISLLTLVVIACLIFLFFYILLL